MHYTDYLIEIQITVVLSFINQQMPSLMYTLSNFGEHVNEKTHKLLNEFWVLRNLLLIVQKSWS